METLDFKHIRADISFNFGPSKEIEIPQYQGLPFSAFNPLEKISKCCDFQNTTVHKSSNASGKAFGEDEFLAVESKHELKSKANKKKAGQKPLQQQNKYLNNMNANAPSSNQGPTYKHQVHSKKNDLRTALYNLNRQQHTRTKFKESNLIKNDWIFMTDISKSHIEKIAPGPQNIPADETLHQTGTLFEYNKTFDRVTPKYAKGLNTKSEKITVESVTLEDNYIYDFLSKEMAQTEEGSEGDITVFTTEDVLTAIMTLKHSNFPWDLTAKKVKNCIVLEKIDSNFTYIDFITVNENISSNMPEDENAMLNQCTQTTTINNEFKKQVYSTEKIEFSNDFAGAETKSYKYRKFTFKNGMKFIVRLAVDSYIKTPEGDIKEISLKTLNEINTIGEWKYKIETAKGALVSSELLNNMCKICKWLCHSHMSGIDTFKIGFVSQNSPKEAHKNSILKVETYKTEDLTKMINFKMDECWSMARVLVDFLVKMEDGKYFLNKNSYKNYIRIFKLPEEKEEA